jgi:NB-ARC domain/Tetratricopeptide repeat
MDTKRTVEVIGRPIAAGKPYYGSGYCLGNGIILTCAHIIPLDITSYQLSVRADLGRLEASVSVAWCNRRDDIALLRLKDTNSLPTAPVPLRDLVLTAELGTVPFEMFGWPRSGNMPGALKTTRDPVHVRGEIEATEFLEALSGLLRLRPRRDRYPALSEGSYWSGMSGAAILIQGTLVAAQVSQPNNQLPYLAGRPVSTDFLSFLDESGRSGTGVLDDAGIPWGEPFTPESQRGIDWPILVGRLPQGADCFQKRPEQAELFMALQETNTVVVTQVPAGVDTQVLTGMGGVGKTQLAASFAKTQWDRRNVDLLVWVNASSRLSVISAYAAAADRIGVTPAGGAGDLNAAANRFWSWLAEKSDKKWLIVLDDVDDPNDLEDLEPPLSAWGNAIVTTRRNDPSYYAEGWRLLKIGRFTSAQALEYLRNRLRDHPDALTGADKLAEDLGYLPLALASASAYIRYIADGTADGPRTCAQYSALLARRHQRLDEELMPTRRIDKYGRTLAATWSISIERVDQRFPSGIARRLMELLSLLDPNGIPFAILDTPENRAYLGSQSPEEIRTVLRVLRDFSLIEFDEADSDLVRIHMLVQRAVGYTTEASSLNEATRALADSMSSQWPAHQHRTSSAELLRSNALALSKANPEPLQTPGLHPLLFQLGESYGQAGLVDQAHEYFTQLRKDASVALGADSRDALQARQRDAYWLGFSGRAEDALRAFTALAADQARVLGPDHPDTLIARHNVARFRGRSGDPQGAVDDLERLVEDQIRVLGPDHIETLKSRNILGYWRSKAGDGQGAVAALEELLAIRIRLNGPDDPETLTTRNDLAIAKADIGDYAGAVAVAGTLVQDRARVLGPEAPATLSSSAYVAYWLAMAGDYSSIADLETIVSDHLRILKARHPNTLRAQAYRIEARAAAGNMTLTQATAEMASHLEIVREVLGPTHILTTHCQQKLADWQGAA